MFGEDFSSDPVSRLLGLFLAFCSHGRISVNTQMFSQVRSAGVSTGSCISKPCSTAPGAVHMLFLP